MKRSWKLYELREIGIEVDKALIKKFLYIQIESFFEFEQSRYSWFGL